MKLKSCLSAALLATMPLSVMAEETKVAEVVTDVPVAVAEVAEEKAVEETPVVENEVAAEESAGTSPWYSGIEFGVGASATSGMNGFVGYANKESDYWLLRRIGVRFDFASTNPISSLIDSTVDSIIGDEGFEIEEITIKDVNIDAKHIGAIIDIYPFGDTWFLGGWRISGGYFNGDLTVDANLTGNIDGMPNGEYGFSFGGVDYKYTGGDIHGTATLDWDYSGPYLGTGFDFGLFAGFKIYVDAGVVFTDNNAQISVDIPTTGLKQYDGSTWQDVNVAELDAEIDRVLSDAQHELNRVDFYPMVKVGFMYRF